MIKLQLQKSLSLLSCLTVLSTLLSVHSFSPLPNINAPRHQHRVSRLAAADGGGAAPQIQYDKTYGMLQEAEKVADGSFLLHVEIPSSDDEGNDITLDYKPGHVLALELEDKTGDYSDDTKNNGGWMRGPYTVSRSTEKSFDILLRVVGKKSRAFVESAPGTPVRFGGKFKVPILDGVNKDDTKKVVLMSTGVGIGPCVGAIEMAMEDDSFPPIALFASFREPIDVVYQDYLAGLAKKHPEKFQWHPVVTSKTGRLSSSEANLKKLLASIKGLGLSDTHYHLIGNGQMVKEWKQGLEKAGIPEEKVTIENYFNTRAETDPERIENIASALASNCAVEA